MLLHFGLTTDAGTVHNISLPAAFNKALIKTLLAFDNRSFQHI